MNAPQVTSAKQRREPKPCPRCYAPSPDDGAARMACGCDSGTHDNSLTQIARYHKGNPWPIRDALRGSAKETSE